MNPSRLFLSPEALEAWVAAERARIEADRLTDTASGHVFELREGVRFLAEVSGAPDARGDGVCARSTKPGATAGAREVERSHYLGAKPLVSPQRVSGAIDVALALTGAKARRMLEAARSRRAVASDESWLGARHRTWL